jgi:hypothetical protein
MQHPNDGCGGEVGKSLFHYLHALDCEFRLLKHHACDVASRLREASHIAERDRVVIDRDHYDGQGWRCRNRRLHSRLWAGGNQDVGAKSDKLAHCREMSIIATDHLANVEG